MDGSNSNGKHDFALPVGVRTEETAAESCPLPVIGRTETTAAESCKVATERNINITASVDAPGCRVELCSADTATALES